MVLPGRAFALCASRRAGGGATFLSAKLRFAFLGRAFLKKGAPKTFTPLRGFLFLPFLL
jgi:hypothetical protein